jgi:hypothetical protein
VMARPKRSIYLREDRPLGNELLATV